MLLGREREVAAVRRAVADAGLAVLVGDAGVGKTSIAAAAVGDPRRHTGALATMRWVPLFPFRRLLDRWRPAEDATPEVVARALLRAGSAPLIIDDLQWADDPSLEVVGLLAGRLAMVATVRVGEEGADRPLGAMEVLGAVRIDVSPLGPAAAAEIVDRTHPDLDPGLRVRTLEVAAGNPLLLRELPKAASASVSLVGVLMSRLAMLPDPVRAAAERLAVLGRPAHDGELGPGAAGLVASGLAIAEGDRTAFVHALLGEVIADDLGERAGPIRRWLAARVPPAEAAHLLAAAGDRDQARALALAAADEVADRRLRAELLHLAVDCADDVDVATRVRAARLLTETSQPGRARALCDVPELEGLPPVDRGSLRGCAAEAAWMLGDQRACFELAELALGDLRGSRTEMEVLVLAGSTVAHTYADLDGRPALARAEEAVALADELGVAQAYARSRLASVRAMAGLDGVESLYLDAIDRARIDGDADVHRQAFVGMVLATWTRGDVGRAAQLALDEMSSTQPDGFDVPWLGVAAYAALLSVLAGRPPEEVAVRFLPILEREPSFRNRAFLEAAVLLALADAGRHGEAARLAEGALSRAGTEPQSRSIVLWSQVEVSWLAGRPEVAGALAAELAALGLGEYPSSVMGRLIGGHAARECGDGPVGDPPALALPAWRAAPIEWRALQSAATGDAQGAAELFLEAADAWAASDARADLRCRWAAGDALAAVDPARAQALLASAEAHAGTLGAIAMANRIRRSLRVAGSARRARSPSAVAGLTDREVEALHLVGAGMPSAAIAGALGVKASTVDSWIRSAMRKLGAPTRVAAVAELDRRRGEASG